MSWNVKIATTERSEPSTLRNEARFEDGWMVGVRLLPRAREGAFCNPSRTLGLWREQRNIRLCIWEVEEKGVVVGR